MADATAKFPAALAALADFGGEYVGLGEDEWTANGAITAGQAVPFSLVVNEAISSRVAATGWLTTLNLEVLHYSAVNAGTKTFTIDLRAQQDTTAAAIDNGSLVGRWLSKRALNQILAEIIALETQALGGIHNPNLIPNSDLSRRTLAQDLMRETFADTSGYQQLDAGAAPTVAANALTFGAANNEIAYPKSGAFWRDRRKSAQFKAVNIAGVYRLRFRIDGNNYIDARMNNGNFELGKVVGGVATTVASVANALTLNNRYWLELETQGVGRANGTAIAKLYSSGAAPTAKPSAPAQTLSGVITDAVFDAGAQATITSDQAAAVWGEIAVSPGGLYVEAAPGGPFAESHALTALTGGGLAYGIDESDGNVGLIGKPAALICYVPATSRNGYLAINVPWLAPSTKYTLSGYFKTSGKGGSGALVSMVLQEQDASGGSAVNNSINDAGEVAWTRKTLTFTTASTTRKGVLQLKFNEGGLATGTGFLALYQLEQGSAATAYRHAPEDVDPIVAVTTLVDNPALNYTTTSASYVEVDSRVGAINLHMPWDGTVRIRVNGAWRNSAAGNRQSMRATQGGVAIDSATIYMHGAGADYDQVLGFEAAVKVAAGKTRLAIEWKAFAGTATLLASGSQMVIVATKGK